MHAKLEVIADEVLEGGADGDGDGDGVAVNRVVELVDAV